MKKLKTAGRFLVFVCVALLCVGAVERWLMPKYYYNQTWPTTNTYKNFYQLKKNSVDVLIFGSSHALTCINPQVIYDKYGIVSYNLGCEQQSLVITYYWLREALKYQSPKVVILDTYILHSYDPSNGMNCNEGSVRKAMDSMRWSPMKWEAGNAIAEIDPEQSALSFSLLNVRYHTRWQGLGEDDYTESDMISHGGIKGFSVLGGTNENLTYTPFRDAETKDVDAEPMMEIMREYLDKIVELCGEQGIQLVLVKIPAGESAARYKSTKEYADGHGLPFYDFNEEKLYHAVGYNAAENLLSHPNYLGAEKVSDYLGKLLLTEYHVAPREDASFDESRRYYNRMVANLSLSTTTDINTYLELIDNEAYSIFLFASNGYGTWINDEIMGKIHALGFCSDLRGKPEGTFYCGVKDGGKVVEKLDMEDVSLSGSVRNGIVPYQFNENAQSLLVGGTQYGNSNPGLSVVVYDNETKSIIDKVYFHINEDKVSGTHY